MFRRNVRDFLARIEEGKKDYHFIEIMTCPGGCIGGGGLPQSRDADILSKRIRSVYSMDERMVKRKSHENEAVLGLYKEFLGEPLSHVSHDRLHTNYFGRPRKPPIALKAPAISQQIVLDGDISNTIYVVFGTQSGTTAQAAKEIKIELQHFISSAKLSPEPQVCIVAGNAMSPDKLLACAGQALATLFVTCTFGEGEFPETMEKLWDYMTSSGEGMFSDSMRFAVFGLGSSMYAVGDQFNRSARRLDAKLEEIGGSRIVDVGLGDDQAPELYHQELDKWMEGLLPKLFGRKSAGTSYLDPPEPLYRLSLAPGAHSTKFRPVPPNYHFVKLAAAGSVVSEWYDRPAALFRFSLDETGLEYDVGDHLAVLPRNPEKTVDSVLDLYFPEVQGSEVLSVEAVDHLSDSPFPTLLTAKELLTQYLDLCGRPSRSFFKQLFMFATTVESRDALRWLFERDNPNSSQDEFEFYTATHTYADVICKFGKESLPPFEYLLSMIPVMTPRLYSIASSPLNGQNRIDLLVVKNEWKDPAQKDRVGLATNFLFDADIGEKFAVQIRSGILQPPEDPEAPIVMFGLGTGVAPFRAFLQHRRALLERGEKLGPATLYVGFRHKEHDYYLKEDFKKWIKEGVLSAIHPAFSHDDLDKRQGKLYFIPDLISDAPDDMAEALRLDYPKDVHVFYCGPALGIPETIQRAMAAALSSNNGGCLTEGDAKSYMKRLVTVEDRFHAECF